MTKNQAIKEATVAYLKELEKKSLDAGDIDMIEDELLTLIHMYYEAHNAACIGRDKNKKWKMPETLPAPCIADVILYLHEIRRIEWGNGKDSTKPILGVYRDSGVDEGLYVEDDVLLSSLIHKLNRMATSKEVQEVIALLRENAPVAHVTADRDLIAVNNGIFNYRTKELMPFSPKYVFMAKSRVDYIPGSQNPVIHNDEDGTDWDVESWMDELSDGDPEVNTLLWQAIGAVIRPHVRWDKMMWLYSSKGMNGKGTFCTLLKQICGDGVYASIPLNAFERDFLLSELLHCTAIITDENPTSEFSKNPATLKSIITGDTFQINRKNKEPVTIRFSGLVVQCLNELPKFGDTTDSLYRRILCIPFNKTFIGCERKYIKSDYMRRREVLEYVLCKALNMDYYEFCEPQVCADALKEYKLVNNIIEDFLSCALNECVWNLIPWSFLYDLYKAWLKKESPSSYPVGSRTFVSRVKQVINSSYEDEFEYRDAPYNVTKNNMAQIPEPLIIEYNLMDWMNPNYKGTNPDLLAMPPLKASYRGLLRKNAVCSAAPVPEIVELFPDEDDIKASPQR